MGGTRGTNGRAVGTRILVQGMLLWIVSMSAAQPQPKEPPRIALPQRGPNTGPQLDVLVPGDPGALRSVQQQLQQARAAPYNTSFAQDLSVEEKASLDLLLQANQDPTIFDRGEAGLQQHVATSFAQAISPAGATAMAPAVPAVARAGAPAGSATTGGSATAGGSTAAPSAGGSATAGGSASTALAPGAGGGGAGGGRNGSAAIAPAPAAPTLLNRQTESDIINQIINRTYNPLSMHIGSAVGIRSIRLRALPSTLTTLLHTFNAPPHFPPSSTGFPHSPPNFQHSSSVLHPSRISPHSSTLSTIINQISPLPSTLSTPLHSPPPLPHLSTLLHILQVLD